MQAKQQRSYDWSEQLDAGKAGEEAVAHWLREQYGGVVDVRSDPMYQAKDIDFRVGAVTFEVKTDYRAHETGNLFLEFGALEKSRADIWLVYIPQRRWLFRFSLEALRDYAELHLSEARTVHSFDARTGATWIARGVPIRMSTLLLHLPAVLYSGVSYDEQSA